MIQNGDFSDRAWRDVVAPGLNLINQEPAGWHLSWISPGQPLYGSADLANGVPECVHKLKTQLPPDEQPGGPNALILAGDATYKIFSAREAFGAELRQTVHGMRPGSAARLTVPILAVLNKETDPFGAESGVWVDGQGNWAHAGQMGNRKWFQHTIDFTVPDSGAAEVIIRVKSKWPRPKDFFIDGITLAAEAAALTDPPVTTPVVTPVDSVSEPVKPDPIPTKPGTATAEDPGASSPKPALGRLPPPTPVAAGQPVDFRAAAAEARANGLELVCNKVGFHVGPGGNARGLGDWMRKLNDAGVPFFLKSTDAAGPLFEGQQLMVANEAAGRNVPHTLVFRFTDAKYEALFYDTTLSAEEAGRRNWDMCRGDFPRELDRRHVWFETLNEPGRFGADDRLQIDRLGRFSLTVAQLAVAQGYRYAAFSFSTGVPEPEDWEHPSMLEFLRFAGRHPDQVAVALHEYSLVRESLSRLYPDLLGRFQYLFEVCDRHGIPRPTILITEWGWTHNDVPDAKTALRHIKWAAWLYAAYPQVKGAAIWYLGPQFEGIANKAQTLIAPLADFSVSHYFTRRPGDGQAEASALAPDSPIIV